MQTDITDRDLCRVRLRFLDLLKSFFQDVPDADRLSRWRGIFAALDKEQVSLDLDTRTQELNKILARKSLQQIKDEHYQLFVDPYSQDLLPLNATYYIDGKSFGPSLVALRDILKQGKLIRESGISDPEDSLAVMLDVMIRLIQEQQEGADTELLQRQLLLQFLVPTVQRLQERINTINTVEFYQKCIAFLNSYLNLEQGLFEEQADHTGQQ